MNHSGPVVVWGLPNDRPVSAVTKALEREGCSPVLLDHRIVNDCEMEMTAGATIEGCLRIAGQTIDLASVRAVYMRPFDFTAVRSVARAAPDSALGRHAYELHDILLAWTELTPALVVNRASAMAANDSKPYQSMRIESAGFRVPETLITTDPPAAEAFWRRHGQVIYKSISGVRSIVSRLRPEHLDRLADIASCPTQFQQYIAGQEYRVHVAGEEIFACAVFSDADDYRYSEDDPHYDSCELPPEIAARCRELTRAMELHVAGLDLRCTPEGEWYCFEVNPSPAFTAYESVTKQPMAHTVARLLASA